MCVRLYSVTLILLVLVAACSRVQPPLDADVIVVGAGIAGLSAALEASGAGATVLVLDVNSVGGGHAVKAGGFALVDTELQRRKGIEDSPDMAWLDFQRWGENPDPYWSRRYAEESGPEVYDWLTELGVEFRLVMDTPEDTVPRFHFTSGTAVNAVVPMLRKAFADPNIRFAWNTRVTALMRSRGAIAGVAGVNERTGKRTLYRAGAVLLATGGFQNNLNAVRAHWPAETPEPERLLKGAGHFATGDGYRLAEWAGADMRRMDDQVTFYQGVINPRDPSGASGFFAQNPAAIWLDSHGRRFINESADSKTIEATAAGLEKLPFWMVFDADGAKRFSLRGSPWLNRDTIRAEFIDNPAITRTAATLDELARQIGVPPHNVEAAVQVWNRMLETGTDYQFGRFAPDEQPRGLQAIETPPYYAIPMYPLTRKSMGGPAINRNGQVVDAGGVPVPGLFAAGELTGVAGINGRHGGSGTFLGPSVLTGRVAGLAAARATAGISEGRLPPPTDSADGRVPDYGQPGYWHYDAVHRLVSERAWTCDRCHSERLPMAPAVQTETSIEQLQTCLSCH